jgi:hypothetical protein
MTKEKQVLILLAALEECLDFFEDNMDVIDGDDGQPEPDSHMRMATFVQQQIHLVLNAAIDNDLREIGK